MKKIIILSISFAVLAAGLTLGYIEYNKTSMNSLLMANLEILAHAEDGDSGGTPGGGNPGGGNENDEKCVQTEWPFFVAEYCPNQPYNQKLGGTYTVDFTCYGDGGGACWGGLQEEKYDCDGIMVSSTSTTFNTKC